MGKSDASFNILFISRAYPPVTGGIENQNFGLAKSLSEITPTTVIANTRGKKFLPIFLPYVCIRMLFSFWRYDAILLGDGVMAPLTWPVQWTSWFLPRSKRPKIATVLHGLDVTFFRKPGFLSTIYRLVNIPALRTLDLLIAVGNQTIEEAVSVGVPREKCVFIPNGIFPENFATPHTREELWKILSEQHTTENTARAKETAPSDPSEPLEAGLPRFPCPSGGESGFTCLPSVERQVALKDRIERSITNKKVIVRVGRYVKHKGVEWFIRNVMPLLPNDVVFVAAGAVVGSKTAGDHDYYPQCVKAARELGLEDRVFLLTNLSWHDITTLYATANIVVSPNIPVTGSLEGFGINVIEAGASGTVVVASRLEGLQDAIIEGETGYFVKPGDAQGYAEKIASILNDDASRREFGIYARKKVIEHFSWNRIAKQYVETLEKL